MIVLATKSISGTEPMSRCLLRNFLATVPVMEVVPTPRSIPGTEPTSRFLWRSFLEAVLVLETISTTRLIPGTGPTSQFLWPNFFEKVSVMEIVPTTRSIPDTGPMSRFLWLYGKKTIKRNTEKICRLKSHRLYVILVDRLESRLNIMNLLIEEYDR